MSESLRKNAKKQDLKAVENPAGIFRTTMAYTNESMLCHFNMKKGAEIPLHHHRATQNGYVVSGAIEFLIGDGTRSFRAEAGSGYAFGADEPHGARVIEDAEVIEVFSPMRPEYADN